MIKVTRTITLNGQTAEEYNNILQHFDLTNPEEQGWKLHKEPLIHKVTAVKTEELQSLPT